MKTLNTLLFAMALLSLFASCQSSSSQTPVLSNQETRKEIMHTIANDSTMSEQMIATMMMSKNGKMMQHRMMENQNSMMEIMKNNPGMMRSMMSTIMETTKGDTSKMAGIIKTMSENPKMMQMMQNMLNNKNMNGMGHMRGMNN